MQELRETLPIGSIIAGRYQIERLLGRGGFGAVYLVRDQRVRNNVFALKEVIDPNKRERDRFTFEAELLKRVDHPSLPRVYRVFEDDVHDRAYMLMDYIEGSNLEKLRVQQPNKQFSVQRVLTIMGPIMDAVSYLHRQHPPIIHRDIKPANIIVPASDAEAVLVDFGIAKEFDPDSTTTAVRHASPGYGAPEQYATGTNTRTDIYGLGATMYALLTGVVPQDAFYRTTQLGSRGVDPLEPIERYAPNVPQHVSNAIYRAMAVDKENRFPTVQEFWRALNAGAPEQDSVLPSAAPVAAPLAGAALASPTYRVTPAPFTGEATTAVSPERRNARRRIGAWLLLLLALLIGVVAAALLLPSLLGRHPGSAGSTSPPVVSHHPTATPTPRPAVTPRTTSTPNPPPTSTPASSLPPLEKQYNGTAHNTPCVCAASMSLSSVTQNGGSIQGTFNVNSPLSGSGLFTGTINNAGVIQFTVHSNQVPAPLFFQGQLQSNGSISGTYCSLDQTGHCNPASGGYGTWQVSPAAPGSFLSFDLLTPSKSVLETTIRQE